VCPALRIARRTDDRIDAQGGKVEVGLQRELGMSELIYRVHGFREADSKISTQAGVQQ
jgi:hypothetical protein